MVQEFHVVRCYSCATFQTQQVCKKPKFTCKICGEKQSVRKEFGRGSGKDCRVHAQKLNTLRGVQEDAQDQKLEAELDKVEEDLDYDHVDYHGEDPSSFQDFDKNGEDLVHGFEGNAQCRSFSSAKSSSKWASYLTREDESEDTLDANKSPIFIPRQKRFRKDTASNELEIPDVTLRVEDDYDSPQINSLRRILGPKEEVAVVENEQAGIDRHPHERRLNCEPGPIRIQRGQFCKYSISGNKAPSNPYPSVSISATRNKTSNNPYPDVSRSISASRMTHIPKSKMPSSPFTGPSASSSSFLIEQNHEFHGNSSFEDISEFVPMSQKSCFSVGRNSDSDLISHLEVDTNPLRDKTYNLNCLMENTNHIKEDKLDQRDSVGGKFTVQDDKMISEYDFVKCNKNLSSAVFRKYLCTDDTDDIDFDL